MKNLSFWVCVGSVSLLTSCASHPMTGTITAVGPAPITAESATPGLGRLVVYSAWSCFNNNYDINHSGYTIYSNHGKRVKWVPNFIEGDYTAAPPTRVALPAGLYKIKAEGGIYGWILVPVFIENGRTTPVYLDDEHHKVDSLAKRADEVRLPDGEIIGWAANTTIN